MSTRSQRLAAGVPLLTALCLLAAHPARASDSARLGAELTPAGAEKAGSKDGIIPAWQPGEAATAGWSWGKKRVDFF
jgi:hypothetical protein